ncbi:hypothetical protein ICM_05577 [Bacillus cereus BAG1X2-3]|uniref:Uncharacterized protein n=1 Tax=Bacillus cereus TaxID=1396 RepID=A0A9X7E0A9_BACCE|nr:hypothetical protein [Bacillus cereus]EOO23446.1 hypothetical protein ICC_06057 [Bacillus cereus BAG1X1-1]EOO42930.1 hypothetical protein ICI_06157 [Bacillus cereus BAG1X2-1]EOO56553.1 hypothetical protein ICM_05577 [Bacillus cereus BAG1X2-3]EOP00182.1 hypothetical protein ICO_06432 [Bacillus cereus BAG2O-1]PHA25496.1 hypothetical protein COE70_03575 [Bacillus cereus]
MKKLIKMIFSIDCLVIIMMAGLFLWFFIWMSNEAKEDEVKSQQTYENIKVAEELIAKELNKDIKNIKLFDNRNGIELNDQKWVEKDMNCNVKTDDGKYKVYFNVKKIVDKEMNIEMYAPKNIEKLVRE